MRSLNVCANLIGSWQTKPAALAAGFSASLCEI
jgi:hypothetical protein